MERPYTRWRGRSQRRGEYLGACSAAAVVLCALYANKMVSEYESFSGTIGFKLADELSRRWVRAYVLAFTLLRLTNSAIDSAMF